MTEKIQTSEQLDTVNESLFDDFMKNEPTPIPKFVPGNGPEQKKLFLEGAVRNPQHTYPLVDAIDFESEVESLERKMSTILITEDNLKPIQEEAYRAISDRFVKMTRFMQAAHDYKHADSDEEKSRAAADYMRYNIEVYGKPDEAVYRGLMKEKLQKIQAMDLDERGSEIRDELFSLVDINEYDVDGAKAFVPSKETVEWMHEAVMELYGPWLELIPEEKEKFTATEIQKVFQDILDTQFDGAADGWKVVVQDAQSINVRTPEKKIIIPTESSTTPERLRKLICHEIGVHVLRSIIGEQTDSPQLRTGTASYYDSDEGLGMVVENAVEGEYTEHGGMYYIIAGITYFENKDFRDTHEIWSRIYMLTGAEGKTIDDAYVEKKRSFSYGNVMRVMRGTDELPWFKDLGYYNGANKIWQFLEKNRGDDLLFSMLIASGKIDPNNRDDRTLALEARSY